MKLFPTVEDLAQATNTEVLSARSGLGYNSRGLRLRSAAQQVISYKSQVISCLNSREERGKNNSTLNTQHLTLPTTYEQLIALPWVGDYVASAILAFAYNEDVAVIDTNIRRILIHQFALDEKTSLKELKAVALEILPRGYARERYNALMDYGALELTAKKSGIRPTTRQSKFEGSRRQVRSWIVKEVINSKLWVISYTDIQNRFSNRDDVQSIVEELVKEGVIEIEDGKLKIKN